MVQAQPAAEPPHSRSHKCSQPERKENHEEKANPLGEETLKEQHKEITAAREYSNTNDVVRRARDTKCTTHHASLVRWCGPPLTPHWSHLLKALSPCLALPLYRGQDIKHGVNPHWLVQLPVLAMAPIQLLIK